MDLEIGRLRTAGDLIKFGKVSGFARTVANENGRVRCISLCVD